MNQGNGTVVQLVGIAVRDGELAVAPDGRQVVQFDLAVTEKGKTVYVPVRVFGDLARDLCRAGMRGQTYRASGHLWRDARTSRNPYPQMMVVAHSVWRIEQAEMGDLFDGKAMAGVEG